MRHLGMKKLIKGAAIVLAATMLGGCASTIAPADYHNTVVATFNDEDIYLSEAMYYVREEQWQTESFYGMIGYEIEGLWQGRVSQQNTYGDVVKTNAMASIYQTRILMANKDVYNVSLTNEDQQKIETAVDEYLESADEKLLESMSATKDSLLTVFTNNALANKVWDAIVSDVNTEVDEEEVRQSAISYFVFREDEDNDADAIKEFAEEAYDLLSSQKPIEVAKNMDITLSDDIINKETGTELSEFALGLQEGESGMFDSDGVYYVVHLDAETDEEATQQKIDSVINERKNELFEERYPELQAQAPALKVVNKVWKGIVLKDNIYEIETDVSEDFIPDFDFDEDDEDFDDNEFDEDDEELDEEIESDEDASEDLEVEETEVEEDSEPEE